MRLWMPVIVDASCGEAVYEEDMPGCCRRSADSGDNSGVFQCSACGAAWQLPEPVEPEHCAFMQRTAEERREGAA